MDKQNLVYPFNEIVFGNKKEPSTDIFYNMNKPQKPYANKKNTYCMITVIGNVQKKWTYRNRKICGCLGSRVGIRSDCRQTLVFFMMGDANVQVRVQ